MSGSIFSERIEISHPCKVVILKKRSFLGCLAEYSVTLNGRNIGFLKGSGKLEAETRALNNTVTLRNLLSGGDSIDFTADEGTYCVTVVYKGTKFLKKKTKKETHYGKKANQKN